MCLFCQRLHTVSVFKNKSAKRVQVLNWGVNWSVKINSTFWTSNCHKVLQGFSWFASLSGVLRVHISSQEGLVSLVGLQKCIGQINYLYVPRAVDWELYTGNIRQPFGLVILSSILWGSRDTMYTFMHIFFSEGIYICVSVVLRTDKYKALYFYGESFATCIYCISSAFSHRKNSFQCYLYTF